MSNIPTTLYLQGGPGLNCAVERAWFGENHPVLWWDPPRFPAEAPNAYQATLDAAAEKLRELHTRQGKPVHVIAWSFGARLALDLAQRAPGAIATLTLLAPSLCLETAFDRLACHLAAKGGYPATTPPTLPASTHAGNHEAFMQRVVGILSTPELFSHYWAPTSGALSARHSALTGTDWFDFDTFSAISKAIIKHPVTPIPPGQIERVLIFCGRHDPFTDPETDINFWKSIIPNATVRIVDSGHMLHFEVPASAWLPVSASHHSNE